MLKIVVMLLFLLPNNNTSGSLSYETCNCPTASNLQGQGQSSNTYTFSWQGNGAAQGYEVWYTRASDSYSSPVSYTTSTAHTFQNLAAGSYTFHVVAVCQSGKSEIIGIEDIIEN